MRAMALDVGDVRIGVALSDPLYITAQGLKTIHRISMRVDTNDIMEIIREYEVDTIVIGLPLSLSGEDSIQTQKVREFRTKLENKTRSWGFKVKFDFFDERFTTVIAEDVLIDASVRRKDRKLVVDKMAATIILQSWLDARARAKKEAEQASQESEDDE